MRRSQCPSQRIAQLIEHLRERDPCEPPRPPAPPPADLDPPPPAKRPDAGDADALDKPPPLFCGETLDPDSYDPIPGVDDPHTPVIDYFLARGCPLDPKNHRPKVNYIKRGDRALIIKMDGWCPIHHRLHTQNHWYMCWYYAGYPKDFYSCHHGDEKENRAYFEYRLDLKHLE